MRRILISGCSSGIGLATSKKLLQDGHQLIGLSRRDPKLPFDNFSFFPCDLTNLEHLEELLKKIQKDFEIDALILNAAKGFFGNIEECSIKEIKELLELNFLSHVLLAKIFLPLFKKKKKGDLIFIGSEAALKGRQKGSIYCATKFALRGFAQAIREECSSSNIRVSIIEPGMVRTPFYDPLNFSPGKREEEALIAEDIAEVISLIFRLNNRAVCEEIILSPLKRVISSKTT